MHFLHLLPLVRYYIPPQCGVHTIALIFHFYICFFGRHPLILYLLLQRTITMRIGLWQRTEHSNTSGCKGLNNQDNAYFTQWCCCGRLIFICTFRYLWSMTLVIWSFSWRNSVDWEALGLNNQDNVLFQMIDADIIRYSLCLTVK